MKCGALAGTTMTVVSVEAHGDEWLVGFEGGSRGRTFHAKTSEGALHEFAFGDDLDSARKRFQGGVVYSARGFLNRTADRGTGSIKVRLQEPLTVLEVRPGQTPLPAKPFWLFVRTRQGAKGCIPFYFSWTNVRASLQHEGNPWDDDFFEYDPAAVYEADGATWEIINSHHVRTGMTRDQVRLSWGRPREKTQGTFEGIERECWVYDGQRLWFNRDELVAIEEYGESGKRHQIHPGSPAILQE